MPNPTKHQLQRQVEAYEQWIDELAAVLEDDTLSDREKVEQFDELLNDPTVGM